MWNQIVDSTQTLGKLQNSFLSNKEKNQKICCMDDLKEENNFLRKERASLYVRLKEYEEKELINNNILDNNNLNTEIGLENHCYYIDYNKLYDDNDIHIEEDNNNNNKFKLFNKSCKIQIQQTTYNENEIEKDNNNKEVILNLQSELQDQINHNTKQAFMLKLLEDDKKKIDTEIDNLKIEILQMLPLRFKINELKQKLDNTIQSLLEVKNDKALLIFENEKLQTTNNDLKETHKTEIINLQNDFKQLQDESTQLINSTIIINIENKGK